MISVQPSNEPAIGIESREQLLYLLAEAAEIEHNLMCCYLFAAFSLKDGSDVGLSDTEVDAVRRWRRAIVSIAIEEMTHLASVANITTAVGGAAHFSRPNFPSAPGLYPSGVVVKLAPFDRETLQHFLFLERPEGSTIRDGEGFSVASEYVRETVRGKCMPSAQDYLTVGHLYRALKEGLIAMAARDGDAATLIGDPTAQIGPEIVTLPGLCAVTDLGTAIQAIDTIVLQGEGTSVAGADSHYRRFLAIAEEYDEFLKNRPDFEPHRPVARNPVMRRPPTAADKVFVEAPDAAQALDLANALYGQMLRCLAQAFGCAGDADGQRMLIDAAIELMFSMKAVAELLTLLPASPRHPGQTAGISFAMLRSVARMPEGAREWALLSERLGELAATAVKLAPIGAPLGQVADSLKALKQKVDRRPLSSEAGKRLQTASAPTPAKEIAPHEHSQPVSTVADGVEVARGKVLTLKFEAKRCIHSRFCVLGLPQVYKANVQGAWLDPDAATVEANVSVAHSCPSGAIRYERHDGVPQEQAPNVNLVVVRENGPYAFKAPLVLNGQLVGYRATMCRCGASKNKPFCDCSHNALGFVATGEPRTGKFEPLEVRDGPLEIAPQRNGPLAVTGNIEIVSGTGRTIMTARQARFCRCGHSANKPFCDGSHARVGFVAD
ncbi:MAG TPA: ferritin-like domain-containing protein [Steroidobacter sp.]|jgi:CDGSH-type Zn-finger protein/uncharacterized Fe-S cluster protein YjdI|nr:ferritin-like domain-containing protein [Steroidobacter sp.]